MKRLPVLALLLLAACQPARSADPVNGAIDGQVDIDAPGSAVGTRVISVRLPDGTHCVVVQNNFRGAGISCDWSPRTTPH